MHTFLLTALLTLEILNMGYPSEKHPKDIFTYSLTSVSERQHEVGHNGISKVEKYLASFLILQLEGNIHDDF